MAWSDWFGKSANQISSDYQNKVNNALVDYNNAWNTNQNILAGATTRADGSARTLGSSLDTYDATNANITQALADNANAGQKTQDYLNPYSQYINKNVTDAVQGSAGAAIQGSGTSNAIAKGVADASSSQWNTANQQALADSANNQNILGAMQQQSENVLTNDAGVQQDYMTANQDWATNKLAASTNLATQTANQESQNKGWLGNALNTIGNFF